MAGSQHRCGVAVGPCVTSEESPLSRTGRPGEGAHTVCLHSFLESKPAPQPWQEEHIWKEREGRGAGCRVAPSTGKCACSLFTLM